MYKALMLNTFCGGKGNTNASGENIQDMQRPVQ